MRIDELYKFNNDTLNDVRTAIDDRLKGIRMLYLPQTIWRRSDKDRAAAMIQGIDKQHKTRRIIRSLEKFVGRSLRICRILKDGGEGTCFQLSQRFIDACSYPTNNYKDIMNAQRRSVKVKELQKRCIIKAFQVIKSRKGTPSSLHLFSLDLSSSLLTYSSASAPSSFSSKNKGLIAESRDWDEEEVSSDDEETKVKALMTLTDKERIFVGKESVKNGKWTKITIKKRQQSSSASKTNLAPAGELKNVNVEDDPPFCYGLFLKEEELILEILNMAQKIMKHVVEMFITHLVTMTLSGSGKEKLLMARNMNHQML
nr:retrovirus-related Pol polyprotein from transposon TNT 1-94 [Tanacetum cinerariifolium]